VDKNLMRFADLPAGALFSHREYGGLYRKLAEPFTLPFFDRTLNCNTSWAWGTDGHGGTGYQNTAPDELVRPIEISAESARWCLMPPVK
jgi:hypothetical protein